MPKKSLQNTGPMLPGFETCETAESITLPLLISWPGVFPARTLAQPESASVSPENGRDSGKSFSASFASFDPDSFLWKTSQLSFTGELTPYSQTWPRAGTMRSGRCYPLRPLVRRISGKEFSLLPTPVATDATGGSTNRSTPTSPVRPTLARMAKKGLLPTPRATDGSHGGPNSKGRYALSGAIHHWPTPQSRDYRSGDSPDSPRMQRKMQQGWSVNLNDAVQMYPTPIARDWRSGKSSEETMQKNSRPLREIAAQGQASGQLNPEFVEWLMGFPIGWSDLEDSETP